MKKLGSHTMFTYRHELENFAKATRGPYSSLPSIFVDGDSWFAYPGRNANFFNGRSTNLIEAMRSHMIKGATWFDISSSKRVTRGVKRNLDFFIRLKFRQAKLDFYMISIGGNDMFENLDALLKPRRDTVGSSPTATDCINKDNLNKRLSAISIFYKKLFKRLRRYYPKLPVITHTYALPVERTRGFSFMGKFTSDSWVSKALKKQGYPDQTQSELSRAIVETIHKAFSDHLEHIFSQHDHCYIYSAIDRNIQLNDKKYWADEIHLSPIGCKLVAGDIVEFMKEKKITDKLK